MTREPEEADVWTIGALAMAALVVLVVVMLSGCTPSQAVTAANLQHAAGTTAAAVLHEECTVRYEQATTREQIQALDDAGCPEAAHALRALRRSHALVVSTLLAVDAGRCTSLVSQAPRECDVAGAIGDMIRAASELAVAVEQIRREP